MQLLWIEERTGIACSPVSLNPFLFLNSFASQSQCELRSVLIFLSSVDHLIKYIKETYLSTRWQGSAKKVEKAYVEMPVDKVLHSVAT